MYTPQYHYTDAWDAEEWADEEAQLRADLAVEQARATRAQNELTALQANDPDALLARLAAEQGQSVEQTRAQVEAIRAAQAPAQKPAAKALPGVDPAKLDELLSKVPDGDFNAATQALLDAGATVVDPLGQHWRNEAPPTPASRATPEQVDQFLNQATSLADLQQKLDQLGLLAGGVS